MNIRFRLKEKLIILFLAMGIIPLVIVTVWGMHRAKAQLENQAKMYLMAEAKGFAKVVQIGYDSINSKIDLVREQLVKNLEQNMIKAAAKERYFKTGYLAIFSSNGMCLYYPKDEYKGSMQLYNKYNYIRDAVHQRQGFFNYESGGEEYIGYLVYNKDLDWIMFATAPRKEVFEENRVLKKQLYTFTVMVGILIVIVGYLFSRAIIKRINVVTQSMKGIAEGKADLSMRLPVLSEDEIGDLGHWFNVFMENLEDVISKVKETAILVSTATDEVSTGAQGLSQSSQEEASAVEEIAATIEEMTSSIKENASNATQGKEKAKNAVDVANHGGNVVSETQEAMNAISEASKKIGDIINTVNEVAFQTNLLALNAAVEAARAGEHGKGFAVVAEEVRNLARRSADAAGQIKDLIEDTVSKISIGDEMVKKTEGSLKEIISRIEEVSQTMDEIAAASSEQARGIDELNRAIAQIDSSTQENASTIEQLASTADSLSNEARELEETVIGFKVSKHKMNDIKTENKPGSDKPQKKANNNYDNINSMNKNTMDDPLDEFEEF